MINIKSKDEIDVMIQAGKIWVKVMDRVISLVKPDVTPKYLDSIAEKMIKEFGAKPSFKGYKGYKYSTCISINDAVVHGIPDSSAIKNGDLVGIDIGVCYQGFHADAAVTIGVGKISPQAEKLLQVTNNSLNKAIKMIKPGIRLSSIQQKIQHVVESNGFNVIRDLAGHGIGRKLQEYPSIPNYVKQSGENIILQPGMTFCLEPMVSIGKHPIKIKNDGWTVQMLDESLSAHFEHTIAVTQNGYKILTQ